MPTEMQISQNSRFTWQSILIKKEKLQLTFTTYHHTHNHITPNHTQRAHTTPHTTTQSCLGDLSHISNKFKDVLNFGFSQLITSSIKPRLKSAIESFQTTSHNITEVASLIFPHPSIHHSSFLSFICYLPIITSSSFLFFYYEFIVNHLSIHPSLRPLFYPPSHLPSHPSIHTFTQDEFNQYEANDPWVQNLIFTIDNILTSFKVFVTSYYFNFFPR